MVLNKFDKWIFIEWVNELMKGCFDFYGNHDKNQIKRVTKANKTCVFDRL